MNPLRLRAQNLKTYPSLDIEIPVGCIGVVGANGAGKSTVVNAIDVALFGPEGRSLEPYLSDDAAPGDTLLLELELEHRGETYRIRRTFTSGSRGKTTLDFARLLVEESQSPLDEGGVYSEWTTLTQGDMKETQALIERTLGLTRDTFRASAMLTQGEGASFTSAQPRDRKRILADVLGLGIWDDAKTLVSTDARAEQKRLEGLAGRISLLEEQVAHHAAASDAASALNDEAWQCGARLDRAIEEADVAKTRHETLAERASQAAQARAALQAAQAEHAALAREQERATQALAELAGAEQKLPELRARAEELKTLEAERDELQAQRHEQVLREQRRRALQTEMQDVGASRRRATEAAENARKRKTAALTRITELERHAHSICDRCEQELPDAARTKAIASNRREADDLAAQQERADQEAHELTSREETLRETLADIEPALAGDDRRWNEIQERGRDLAHAREDLAAALERIDGHRQTGTLREPFSAELAAAERKKADTEKDILGLDSPEPADVERSRAAAQEAERAAATARSRAEETRERLAHATARLELIEQAARDHSQATAEREVLLTQLDELQLLERAFGRDGVPTWILETSAIPALELEADRLLTLLGTDYRVELRTERAKKAGGTSETLDVVLLTPTGERDYASFSGGERTRLNLALRLALARLLAHRKGTDTRLLCIDEPEFLDNTGTELLVEALHEMHASGEFDKVLLVSHVPALRDAFDSTLQVSKTDGRSEVLVT